MDTRSVVSSPLDGRSPVELIAMGARTNPAMEAVRLERILAPASREQRLQAIMTMMGQFGVSAPKEPEEARLFFEGYLLAMEGYPAWCIGETCRAFVRGTVSLPEKAIRDLLPKPATIGAELSQRVDGYRSALSRAMRQRDENLHLGNTPTTPRSDRLREMGDRRVAELRALSQAERERLSPKRRDPEYAASRPLTAEDLKDVPDAPRRTGSFVQAGMAGGGR